LPFNLQAALMALGLPDDIAEVLANEDIEYPLLAERIVAVGIQPSAVLPLHISCNSLVVASRPEPSGS
jgi:hypothetical protein